MVWTAVERSGTYPTLYDVWGSGPNDVWAVGAWGTILHFDGESWSLVDAGLPNCEWSDKPCSLYAVWGTGPDNVWIGGENNVWLHLSDSGTWSILIGGEGGGPATKDIHAIWAAETGECWIMSGSGRVAMSDGSWPGAEAATGFNAITGTSATDIWRVDSEGRIEHYDGTTWTYEVTFSGSPRLLGIWAGGSTSVIAVGAAEQDLDNNKIPDAFIGQWDGMNWAALYGNGYGALTDVWGSGPTDVWAVGYQTYFQHWDGVEWTAVPSGHEYYYFGIWGSGPDDVWAVGSYGAIMHGTRIPDSETATE